MDDLHFISNFVFYEYLRLWNLMRIITYKSLYYKIKL